MAEHVNTLLLLVDLQNAFCDANGSVAQQGWDITTLAEAAHHCNRLASDARARGIPVAWTRMMFRPDYSDAGIVGRMRPNLCRAGGLRAGTADVELTPLVNVIADDIVIDKARHSSLYGTPLEVILRARTIERVIVGGVTTSMCVETTVRDLAQRDYEVIVPREACADFDAGRHAASLAVMAFGFARVVPIAETFMTPPLPSG
ncbi:MULTISPECIES: isochorismatase family cysteine hydrolase [unclassified Chelatococcus]|uniref:cysteine hydrolase family protein n=1 Tax=unclassified Chelatococcus TaxID=2638111 RepID=UPI001BCDDD69|nr:MULTISPECIES: isochorismatase family cysteine hydrolase [unclassified Chelatococcus]CAH1657523.1 Isochorismatase [Hyphomicrobiales bacterium]MBS7742298.1 cysteine hydrolase [Chelatococcus sp. HY11]MBX3542584.1 cysteine hydrolase [Chelatococcus sp.]MCO5075199.1 cysteine hydrolase [Chelatococcus sp.]CAH1689181.1 Isochorismatase [Hyphomicrobiales bacterium]